MTAPVVLVADRRWLSEAPAPQRLQMADDQITADAALRLLNEGTALLWQGDFHNAKQLLQALGRRLDRKAPKVGTGGTAHALPSADDFHRYRMWQAQKARTLGRLLLPLEAGYYLPLRRAPEVAEACGHAFGSELTQPALLPLRELQGLIGAYEWHKRGVPVSALGASIHPHYGVFAPVRGEYVDLVAQAPLPAPCQRALDLGTGTGVLAALLARRGVSDIVASDASARAIACAEDNLARLGCQGQVRVVTASGYPAAEAPFDLVVCNPPWLPGKAGSTLEQAVYDPDSRLLRAFLAGLAAHLSAQGEGWLILSDLAELLGLRSRAQLETWIAEAGLRVAGRLDTRPRHARAQDAADPLHAARAREVTSLWRLSRC